MQLSPQQETAVSSIQTWLTEPTGRPIFRLFGYAGTGKTTITKLIAEAVGGRVCYCAFTGKAALVMRKNGCFGASTIHRLIYEVQEDPLSGEIRFVLNHDKSALRGADLCIIDECSMVDEELAKDLLSFNVPLLVVGDPGQLPPVRGAGYFINAEPDHMLTEIHRQAKGNPIIRLATSARENQRIHVGEYKGEGFADSSVIVRADLRQKEVLGADQVLCGLNRSRLQFNHKMRALKFPAAPQDRPMIGERLVCLSNRHDKGLLNGSLWNVTEILDRTPGAKKKGKEGIFYAMLKSEDEPEREPLPVAVPLPFFVGKEEEIERKERRKYDELTFGYVLTTHKAQGSQWGNVLVFNESMMFRDKEDFARRWTYTALTRAADRVTMVLP